MACTTRSSELTPDQQAEADRIHSALMAAAEEDIRALAMQMSSTTDSTIVGENEFASHGIFLRVAAKGLEIALEGRKKGGTKGPVGPATLRRIGPIPMLAEHNDPDVRR